MTVITRDHLADGREIIYFDETTPPERRHDHRPLDPRPPVGQARFDVEGGDWVAVAAHRQTRTYMPPADQCPLCPSTEERHSEIPDRYEVAVFENRFPSLGPDLGVLPERGEWGKIYPAYGRCEVITYTPKHEGSFGELSDDQAKLVVDAWTERTRELSGMEGIRQVFPFENRGKDIGVTLQHPHGQIYAYSYIPARAQRLAEESLRFFQNNGGTETLLANTLKKEREDGSRIIQTGEHFTSYVPFAAHWPLEAHLVPHRHVRDFTDLSDAERAELALMTRDLLARFDQLYDSPTPYIAAWMQAPLDERYRESSTFHLQVTSPRRAADKLKYLAGSEAAMSAFINDMLPERIAAMLRLDEKPLGA
ncbi:galactose-1-phosphate uridylyltransferase [Haematomicrobium sanguinis]|uniref:galactose-1-phosphate uridylyltransferase n=1 Tax=Haematomicrobium sanguinis TaxID=479106 RepID=UPI0005551702|nr:galactose-1-phosphate uridylyltransferase [Haematomicrobium sanguinis]